MQLPYHHDHDGFQQQCLISTTVKSRQAFISIFSNFKLSIYYNISFDIIVLLYLGAVCVIVW